MNDTTKTFKFTYYENMQMLVDSTNGEYLVADEITGRCMAVQLNEGVVTKEVCAKAVGVDWK